VPARDLSFARPRTFDAFTILRLVDLALRSAPFGPRLDHLAGVKRRLDRSDTPDCETTRNKTFGLCSGRATGSRFGTPIRLRDHCMELVYESSCNRRAWATPGFRWPGESSRCLAFCLDDHRCRKSIRAWRSFLGRKGTFCSWLIRLGPSRARPARPGPAPFAGPPVRSEPRKAPPKFLKAAAKSFPRLCC